MWFSTLVEMMVSVSPYMLNPVLVYQPQENTHE